MVSELKADLAEKDARIAALEAELATTRQERMDVIRERNASRAECEGLRAALEALMNAETVSVHVGYDNGPGGGNFAYVDAVRIDDDAFSLARAALSLKETGRE